MSDNFDRLNAAIDAVISGIADVAAAIRNPATDNSNQDTIDALAGKLEGLLPGLAALKTEEDAEDGVVVEPAPDNGEPTE